MALRGRVAIITGSSSGVGAGIAVAFSKEGSKLSLTGRNQKNLEEVVKNCRKAGCEDVLINVGDSRGVNQEEVRENRHTGCLQGRLYIIEPGPHTFGYTKRDQYLDLRHGYNCECDAPGGGIYIMSKVALETFTRYLAQELASKGVRVNAINPGYVPSQLISRLVPKKEISDEIERIIVKATPVGRAATAEEIGHIVAFLASDKAAFVTGECFRADGGYTMTTPPLS